jgi:hypothetical protein
MQVAAGADWIVVQYQSYCNTSIAILQYYCNIQKLQPPAAPAALAQCIPVSLIGVEEMINACLDRHCTQQVVQRFRATTPSNRNRWTTVDSPYAPPPQQSVPTSSFLEIAGQHRTIKQLQGIPAADAP